VSASVQPIRRPDEGVRFAPLTACWICGGRGLDRVHECLFDLSEYRSQDPQLALYTGARVWITRCSACGFAQPSALPMLPRFFERMYDQRWSESWLAAEFMSEAKTYIFDGLLDDLERRLPPERRTILDVGAHVGRFVQIAAARGWKAEGIELNPRTAEYAARQTAGRVQRLDARALAACGRLYDAVTLTDVLEHIPNPRALLETLRPLVAAGGWIAVKVPCGTNQLWKERIRVALGRAPRVSVADNLVHVSHFSPPSLLLALELAGFTEVEVGVGAPETPEAGVSRAARLALFHAARATGSAHSPLTFNLQAFARRGAAQRDRASSSLSASARARDVARPR
jgi:Methyltransferase domain